MNATPFEKDLGVELLRYPSQHCHLTDQLIGYALAFMFAKYVCIRLSKPHFHYSSDVTSVLTYGYVFCDASHSSFVAIRFQCLSDWIQRVVLLTFFFCFTLLRKAKVILQFLLFLNISILYLTFMLLSRKNLIYF